KIVAAGTPEKIARTKAPTAKFLRAALEEPIAVTSPTCLLAAEDPGAFATSLHHSSFINHPSLQVTGAREHNLKDISVSIPHKEITVITGVSGSGKSTLAFDIIFAEGQR